MQVRMLRVFGELCTGNWLARRVTGIVVVPDGKRFDGTLCAWLRRTNSCGVTTMRTIAACHAFFRAAGAVL
jgi:hypothetical protein